MLTFDTQASLFSPTLPLAALAKEGGLSAYAALPFVPSLAALSFAPEKSVWQSKAVLFGLLGNPVSQSPGQSLHNAAFQYWAKKNAKLAEKEMAQTLAFARYARFHIQEQNFPRFMQAVRQKPLAGLSVTMPYKQAVIPYLDALSPLAKAVGAVNTLFWQKPDSFPPSSSASSSPAASFGMQLWGHNTDVEGFMAPLRAFPRHAFTHVLLLGAGGAARAALFGLLLLKAQGFSIQSIWVANRAEEKALTLAQEGTKWQQMLAPEASLSCHIQGIPLAMLGKENFLEQKEISLLVDATSQHIEKITSSAFNHSPFSFFPPAAIARPAPLAYAMVYKQTPLLAAAKRAGWQILDGRAMFMAQAASQFFLWTGLPMFDGGNFCWDFPEPSQLT